MQLKGLAETEWNTKAVLSIQEVLFFFWRILKELESQQETSTSSSSLAQDVNKLAFELQDFISRHIDTLAKDKRYNEKKVLHYIKYFLAALIDEFLVTREWPGRSFWRIESLEKRMFATRAAGDLFFEYCQEILNLRDYKLRDSAYCAYCCLMAGFRGRYFAVEHADKIDRIKEQLLAFYTEKYQDETDAEDESYPPETQRDGLSELRLCTKDRRRVKFILIGIIFVFFIILFATSFYYQSIITMSADKVLNESL